MITAYLIVFALVFLYTVAGVSVGDLICGGINMLCFCCNTLLTEGQRYEHRQQWYCPRCYQGLFGHLNAGKEELQPLDATQSRRKLYALLCVSVVTIATLYGLYYLVHSLLAS